MARDVIAMVGAGKGGAAILDTLLKIPDVEIRYVYDVNPAAPGLALAREHGIEWRTDATFSEIAANPEIALVFEVTGDEGVYRHLLSIRSPKTNVIGFSGTRIIFHLLDAQQKVTGKLEDYKRGLEARILERTEEIEKTNLKLQQQVLEYEELNRTLEKLSEEKTRYLLQATHQLKAPFAAIQSYTDILLDGYAGKISEPVAGIVGKIKARCELLSRSIKGMLELASLKSLRTEDVEMKEEDLNEVLSQAIECHAVIAKQQNVDLKLTPHRDRAAVRGNFEQMVTLFSIFIENGIRYSESGTAVDVRVELHRRERWTILVRDRGVGIPKENLPKIFSEWFRSNNAVRKHPDGTGLGLPIARRIADLHGFSVAIDSDVGAGTTVAVTAPVFNET